MARDPQSIQVPLRTSSVNVDHLNDSQEDLRSEKANNRTSKAQKVLGTAEIPIQQNSSPRDDASSHKRRTRRPSFMKGGGFVPFPTINADDGMAQPNKPQLRVRASSPLLLNTQGASPASSSSPKKTVHQSGSSSTLFSYFNSRDSTIDSPSEFKPDPSSMLSLSSKNSAKESKRKLRPPRIDLSLLFPKPKPEKPTGGPLLSPQRMVHSPTPLSTVGESSRSNNSGTRRSGRRYTETQSQTEQSPTVAGPPPAIPRPGSNRSAPAKRSSAISTDTRNTEFLEPSLQRTVRTSEMDMALQNYSEQQQQQQQQQQAAAERAQSDAASSVYSRNRDQLHSSRSRTSDKSPRRVLSNGSMGGLSKETYLSPKSQPCPARRRPSPSPDKWPTPPPLRETDSSSMSKKSGKSMLANSDLNTSSVLCLSSSEDEDDEQDEGMANDRTGTSHLMRDSVTTYGEFEPEICTASAAQATRGPAVRRLDLRQASNVNRRGPTMLMSPSIHRNGSMSTVRSSYIGRRVPSSGIPTISEPDISDHFPAPGGNGRASQASREIKETNRRSRVIAVTRQEESLLEAMRQRRGKVTPSLFNEARFSQNTITTQSSNPNLNHHNHNDNNSHAIDTDKESMLSAPSRDSLYSADMSFLRLSASIPSYTTAATTTNDNTNSHSRTDQGAAHLDKEGSPSQGSASDAEQKTLNSPRASLVYSESLPSPATSGASPLTPTLPIHHFSPLPNQTQHSPPSRSLPTSAPSRDQRRHSRRRTDSSEAIVLGEATDETAKETDEFPIWALGWNHDLAAIH